MRVIVTKRTPIKGYIETIECTSRDDRHRITVTEDRHGFSVTTREVPRGVIVWVCPRCGGEIADIAYNAAKFTDCHRCKQAPLTAFVKKFI